MFDDVTRTPSEPPRVRERLSRKWNPFRDPSPTRTWTGYALPPVLLLHSWSGNARLTRARAGGTRRDYNVPQDASRERL